MANNFSRVLLSTLFVTLIFCLFPLHGQTKEDRAIQQKVEHLSNLYREGNDLIHLHLKDLPAKHITSLLHHKKGDDNQLLVSSTDAGVIILDLETLTSKKILDATTTGILPTDCIFSMCLDKKLNTLYLGTNVGVCIVNLTGSPKVTKQISLNQGPLSNDVKAIGKLEASSHLFLGTPLGLLIADENGTVQPPQDNLIRQAGRIHQISSFDDLTLWFCTDSGLLKTRNGIDYELVDENRGEDSESNSVLSLAQHQNGVLLLGTMNGLKTVGPGTSQIIRKVDGLPDNWITAVGVDSFKRLTQNSNRRSDDLTGFWAGSHNHGVARYSEGGWSLIDQSSGQISSNRITTILSIDEAIFIGTADEGLNYYRKRRFSSIRGPISVLPESIQTLAHDGKTLYVGTTLGIYTYSETEGIVSIYSGAAPLDLCCSDKETLWAIHDNGKIQGYREGEWFDPTGLDNLTTRNLSRLHHQPDKGTWIAMAPAENVKVYEKLAFIDNEDQIQKEVKPDGVLEVDWDATKTNSSTPQALYFTSQFRYVGLDDRRAAIAEFRDGRWLSHIDISPPVHSICQGPGENVWFGTRNGIIIHNQTRDEFTHLLADPIRKISFSTIEGIIRDPNNPNAFFMINNTQLTGRKDNLLFDYNSYLFYYFNNFLEYVPLPKEAGKATDLLILQDSIWVGMEGGLFQFIIEETKE